MEFTTAQILQIINILLERIGNMTLAEAKSWIEVKANAEALKREIAEGEIVVDEPHE